MTKKGTTPREAALDLAKRGLAVHPVKTNKQPASAHGFLDASTDPADIDRLFVSDRLNIGIATGPASKVWVLDVEAEGLADLEGLERKYGKLPETLSVATGGGGRHLYFEYNGREITNTTKLIGLAIDVRAKGGYAIAPPSLHKSGKRYEWETPLDSTPIAKAPDWLLDLVTIGKVSTPQAGLSFTIASGEAVLDLAAAPGAGKGQRHDQALRLIGSAIGRGLDSCEVATQAIAWGQRCTPPLTSDEILKIVSDLSRKQATAIEVGRAEVEAAPIPEAAPWPKLDEAAICGPAGAIVKALSPETEADPTAILIQLLVFYGNLCGRGPYFAVEGTTHHGNLFAVLVGATAKGRKGTSEGRVRQILRFVDQDWEADNIATGLVSGEGLVHAVRDPIHKGEDEIDAGISDKRLLVVESEFASVLRVCRRETNTLSPMIRQAWDSGTMRTLAKNVPCRATNAHISIIGHIVAEELRAALAEADGLNGFANRFLWVAVRRSKLLPDGGQDVDLSRFAERLATAARAAQFIGRMRRDQGAAKLWREIYAELAADNATGLLAGATSRAEAQVLRLSIVYALLDASPTITVEHLAAAKAVWDYCRQSARLIFGNASGNPLEDRVLETIRQHPGGIGRWELHIGTCKHKKIGVLVEILARLRDAGSIESRIVATAGRSAETWFPVQGRGTEGAERGGRVIEIEPSTPSIPFIPGNGSEEQDLSSLPSLPSQRTEPEWETFEV